MGWLEPTQDEVAVFHPAFEAVAREALAARGLDATLEWRHHPRTSGLATIPDFVLVRRSDGRWLLALELKRTREAVLSTRFQLQAKGYAETNRSAYARPGPCFFAISNLEVTLLFALNGGAPPAECRLKEGAFVSGELATTTAAEHRARFAEHLGALVARVASGAPPEFDAVWPAVASELLARADALPDSERLALPDEPATPGWDLVRSYFAAPKARERVFLLRCLLAGFLRGFLDRERGASVPPIRTDRPAGALRSLAQAVDRLRALGFEALFEAPGGPLYAEGLPPEIESAVFAYLKELDASQVAHHARTRNDAVALPGLLFDKIYPAERDESGKVQTDPELAAVLATLVLREPATLVLDPCSGEGTLVAAAFDRLVALGVPPGDAFTRLHGIEADPLSYRLGAMKVALKDARALAPGRAPRLVWGDMFAHGALIASADAVLMNPPFKRYERQDARPVPDALRAHCAAAIEKTGAAPTTTSGQANLFHHYVELVVRAAKPGARIGLILDNRWYHSQHGRALRELLLEHATLEALVEYPHWPFFEQHRIATSIAIVTKRPSTGSGRADDQRVRFVRCRADPRTVDLAALARAFHEGGPWPLDWSERAVPLAELDPRAGWKARFTPDLALDFRAGAPRLAELFESSRRGSLNKEEGGVGVLELPFGLESFGFRRDKQVGERRPYQTRKGDKLSKEANAELRALAAAIPDELRGWALKNSDDVEHFVLEESDVTRTGTLEPPALRALGLGDRAQRAPWSAAHDAAVAELDAHPASRAFLEAIERHANLTEAVLPRAELWVGLREPPAGELIVPRKTRSGHRVHVNPFTHRAVRLSSNFVSYAGCRATGDGLSTLDATKLVAAFLVSSFGQLQFEMLGYNREGLLSLECEGQLDEVRVLDPRALSPDARAAIFAAFTRVPAPVPTDRLSDAQPERNALDALIAGELVRVLPALHGQDPAALLREVHERLDEWLTARQP